MANPSNNDLGNRFRAALLAHGVSLDPRFATGEFSGFLEPEDAAWQAALSCMDHDFYHLSGYASLSGSIEGGTGGAFFHCSRDLMFLLPLILRPVPTALTGRETLFDASSPYGYPGPLMECPDRESGARKAFRAFTESARARGLVCSFIRSHPLLPFPFDLEGLPGEIRSHGRTVVIQLQQTDDEFWSQTRTRHRRSIRSLMGTGYTVEINNWSNYAEFQRVYLETMDRVGSSGFYLFGEEYFESLRALLGERLVLCTVNDPHGNVAAAGIFSAMNGLMQYHLGGTSSAHLVLAPSKLMFHEIRRWGRDAGFNRLHLGGGLGGMEDDLFHFKAGFSPLTSGFCSCRIVHDQQYYDRMCDIAMGNRQGIESHDADFFPAYRTPS